MVGKAVLALAEATGKTGSGHAGAIKPKEREVQGRILQFLWFLKRKGRAEETLKTYSRQLKHIVKQGVNIFNPEEVEKYIAEAKVKTSYKQNLVYMFKSFYKFLKLEWEAPTYKAEKKIPFIPTQEELNTLISNASKNVAAFLVLLRDTGARKGEILKLEWSDIDFEHEIVRITAEKNSNPRVLPISKEAVTFLKRLPKKRKRIFNRSTIETGFYRLRKRLAFKLNNSRLLKIGFHTFRHWFATMKYHKLRDLRTVQKLLGHKSILNTQIYEHIEEALFQKPSDEFIVKTAKTVEEATKLAEVGFEHWDTVDGVHIYRKRR